MTCGICADVLRQRCHCAGAALTACSEQWQHLHTARAYTATEPRMGFTRRARRLLLLLPHVAIAATLGTAAALTARHLHGRRRRQQQRQKLEAGQAADPSTEPSEAMLWLEHRGGSGKAACSGSAETARATAAGERAAAGGGGSALAFLLQQLGVPSSAFSTRDIISRLRSAWITFTPDAAKAALEGGEPERVVDPALLEAISGEWSKDFRRCEPMDEFFSLFGVNRVLRRAARLMRGMKIELRDDELLVTQLCAVRWLSVTENFPLAPGARGEHRRRDMRRGAQRGTLAEAQDGAVRLEVCWGPPLEGCAVDEMRLVPVRAGRGRRRRGGGGGGGTAAGPASAPAAAAGVAAAAAVSPDDDGDDEYELHVTSSAYVGGRKARFNWVCVKRQ